MLFSIDLNLLTEQIKATSLLEWFAVSFGVASVLLARKNNVLLYPAGIIGILCSSFLLVDAKLYAETLLHAYYLVMSIYGWAIWKDNSASGASQISRSTANEQKITWAIAIIGWGFLYFMLTTFTDSDVPIVDAFVSSTAWAGMWLLAKRKLENWIWLNVSNLVAIPLLFHKDLILISFLTIFLFVVAIFGYFDWRKELDQAHGKLKTV
ncbi:nicotinamide mononucleotide transporter [Algoriphagus ratkowskyi]|uniref:Nicotinamide riboside transporter PnuC n=1 Tax=Algoriphagus ratkowskyi TaxID=57028 RepID=A0A2W7R872_9BACT|nr:nicotinamide riboside transporter PnuC [Algoriphagus ratkowskyi]PZX57058.1 nicotinamide mononucleotide transporter [Algoriphagus ratkowskyi]TXD79955.1 nicotinamide mononucleotide transporter [Algoriphagus ratkowskyi]